MQTPFRKMQGAGNDFVIMDARAASLPLSGTRVAALADRRTGIGCDQFITLLPAAPPADVFMRIHNPDGNESGTCGNATRCVAALLHEETGRTIFTIQAPAGLLPAEVTPNGIAVDMGPPRLHWADIPLAYAADTLHLPVPGDAAAASMGNPHATFFVEDTRLAETQGGPLQNHPIFAEGANIGFAQILSPTDIRLRVHERGAGLTLACGSGACAALVNAHRRGLTGRAATLSLDGGTLHIAWRASDDHVIMTGPTATSFHGTVDLSTYPP
jgi:diaminopimelate epimerase